ncbi:MAG: hypothetical protein EP298_02200 [Gammaproteobacteria bacterium]|nr:MAG: hypothetical protein EP298_02200 [Gammaproteobacteria bacterium]UTW42406.1 hypothetical protein KFE69_13135 [bacterium SCSIO 12844]
MKIQYDGNFRCFCNKIKSTPINETELDFSNQPLCTSLDKSQLLQFVGAIPGHITTVNFRGTKLNSLNLDDLAQFFQFLPDGVKINIDDNSLGELFESRVDQQRMIGLFGIIQSKGISIIPSIDDKESLHFRNEYIRYCEDSKNYKLNDPFAPFYHTGATFSIEESSSLKQVFG